MVRTIARLSCAVLLVVSAVPAKAVEVITNGGFESGLTGWTGFATANGTISQIPGYAGGTRDLAAINDALPALRARIRSLRGQGATGSPSYQTLIQERSNKRRSANCSRTTRV